MSKKIAQQLNIKEFTFEIKDENGKIIYREDSTGFWSKTQYNENGKEIYFEDSNGFWSKTQYNENGKEIYYENSTGLWFLVKT